MASTIALVESALEQLGYPPATSRITDDAALRSWQIPKGSALTRVSLLDRTEFTHIRVCAVVMTVDAKVDRPALHAHLLELNAGLSGAAFATAGDQVLLLSERSTLDLDRSEVLDVIKRVSTCADDHDDALVARFGGSIGVVA